MVAGSTQVSFLYRTRAQVAHNNLGANLGIGIIRHDMVDLMSLGTSTRKHLALGNEGRWERVQTVGGETSHDCDDVFTPAFGHTPSTCLATYLFLLFRGRTSTRSVAAGGC